MTNLRFDVISLFPDFFLPLLKVGIIGKAFEQGIASLKTYNPRDFSLDKYRKVDDEPYGGGPGMVLKPEPFFAAYQSIPSCEERTVLLLTPQGKSITQNDFCRWSAKKQIVLICGSYEGFDERIRTLANEEVSVGDFVLTGGEIPAMLIINGVLRLIPNVVGSKDSLADESHNDLLLEHPQYTRPAEFKGLIVPDILRSGDHHAIKIWRQAQRELRTNLKRPDLYYRWRIKKTESQFDNSSNLNTTVTSESEPIDYW